MDDAPPTVRLLVESGVVLLGGTAGVGLETARHFAAEGSRLLLLGCDTERGAAAVDAVRQRVPGADVGFVRVDAIDPAATVTAAGECRERLGAIDVLVCSTGLSAPPRLLHEIPIDDVRARIDEVVLPPLHLMHAVWPGMRQAGGGSVVVVASDAAPTTTRGQLGQRPTRPGSS